MKNLSAIELYDTGREQLALRVACFTLGAFGLYAAVRGFPSMGAILAGVVSACLIAVWFLRTRIYFDSERRELICRSKFFGWTSRVPLDGAEAIYAHEVRMLTSTISGIDLWIRYSDGRKRWITQVSLRESDAVQKRFSDHILLPIVRMKKEPNKAPEPTSGIVTSRAEPRAAPIPPVAHL